MRGDYLLVRYIKEKNRSFYKEFISSKFFLSVLFLYVILKLTSNIYYGASYFNAFRSGILGLTFYLLGFYIITIFSTNKNISGDIFNINYKAAKKGLIISSFYFIFLFMQIIDKFQRREIITGSPIFSYIPGYNFLISLINNISIFIASRADFISPNQIENIITNSIFYIIIPIIIFKLLGYSFKNLFSFKNTRASWPFLIIYILAFLLNGLNLKKIWGLFHTVLHPGLTEEFFHRGIIYRFTESIFNRIPVSLVIGTIYFSIIHFPSYYFTIYNGNLLMTFSNMADIFIMGMFWAYGFRKTGTLIPWILIHAFSNIPYLF